MKTILFITSLFKFVLSGPHNNIQPIGSELDNNDCLISAGFSWCESSNSCIRQWMTPCEDNYTDCEDCLDKQRNGINIACPENCNMISIDPVYIPPPPMPPTPPPVPSIFHSECPDTMCMMYCEHGFNTDENGCNICECNEQEIIQPECTNEYVCPKVTELYTDKVGYITYQLSLIINSNQNIKNIFAIYGDSEYTMYIPGAYQVNSILGKNIGGINNYIINMNSESKYDSWLTIDITDGDPNDLLSTVGIDFKNWDENNGLTINNGAIFFLNPNDITIGDESIIGQLTIKDNYFEEMMINVQGKFLYNTEFWSENKIIFKLKPPNSLDIIPRNCIRWFDGCNTCIINNNNIMSCSRIMCFSEETPYCEIHYNLNGH